MMKEQISIIDFKFDSKQDIIIRNILRSLGLNISHKGTILLIKAIQIAVKVNSEFIIIDNIYKLLSNYYKTFNTSQIKMTIKYALDHRNEQKAIKNFENIFGFEYDEYIFTNKNFIEEILRIII